MNENTMGVEDDLGFVDFSQVDIYLPSVEEELEFNEMQDEKFKEKIKEELSQQISDTQDGVELSENGEAEQTTSTDDTNTKLNVESKSKFMDKAMSFVEEAARYGFQNYIIAFLLFYTVSSIKDLGETEKALGDCLKDLGGLSETCKEAADEILKFEKYNSDSIEKLDQLQNETNADNCINQGEELLKMRKEQTLSYDDKVFIPIDNKINEMINSMQIPPENVKVINTLKARLKSEATKIVGNEIIARGYDISAKKNSLVVKENDTTYNTRMKTLKDKGIISEQEDEDEPTLTKLV